MSFLFGKRKDGKDGKGDKDARPGGTPLGRELNSAQAGNVMPQMNGVRSKERGPGVSSPAPGAGVNASAGSIEGTNTPSPEHNHDQRGLDHDIQQQQQPQQQQPPPRSMPMGPPNPAALYPWSQRRLTFTSSQPNPFPRYGAAVNANSSKEGEVYLMGGLVNGSTVKGDLWMIEAGGTNLACYPIGTTFEGPGPRVGHASLLVGNAFIVFGGDTKMEERDKLDDTLYLLNTSTRHWSRSIPPGTRPAGRYGHTLNILGSRIYVFGGQVEGYFFNDLVAFDLNTLQNPNTKWEMLIQNSQEGGPAEGQIPPARTNHTIVSWNDKLYLFGGTNGTQWFNDVWSYDPKQISWTQLDCIGYIPAPREGHSAALVGDVMYIFGGRTEEGTDLGDLAAFRITSRRWYTFQNMGPSPSPRSGHSMTSYGKQIVVLAGEPSSAPRDPGELSLVYVLDTAKIRYPNDQQIQQTPAGERVPGNRRPSQERGGPGQRAINGPPNGAPDSMGRKFSNERQSLAGPPNGPGPAGRGQDPSMANGPSPQGRGAQIPRGPMAPTPSGPPPQQQAPAPRSAGPNGITPQMSGPRARTPTGQGRGYGPPLDTGKDGSFENEPTPPVVSPVGREQRAPSATRAMSPAVNGRRTPQQAPQPSRLQNFDDEESPKVDPSAGRSRSRLANQEAASEEVTSYRNNNQIQNRSPSNQFENVTDPNSNRGLGSSKNEAGVSLSQFQQIQNQHQGLQSQHQGLQTEHQSLQSQHENVQRELETAKSRNAWYASELALAKKAGYQPNTSPSNTLDENSAKSFGDEDRPLIEALIAVRAQLAEVRGSITARENAAAQQVAEVEHQRDNAVREAAYAKAKLAAHGGVTDTGTPQSESGSRDLSGDDRSGDISKKLAAALATQNELRRSLETMTNEAQNERRARELAESSADAAQKRATEFEGSRNPGELESLRTELHQVGKTARDESAAKSEAHAKFEMLEVEHNELTRKHQEALESLDEHTTTLTSLREAVAASTDKSNMLEKKLEEERRQRSLVDQKILQLRSEHEERTAELDETVRKLRDAEDMVSSHAAEAKTHRQAVIGGLDKLSTRSISRQDTPVDDERVPILKKQVESAHTLVRKNQADADAAAEKLRSAEERIAGLEAYQEQSSRESLTVRKQLQEAVRESQALQVKYSTATKELETHQRDLSALGVKHGALKELLDERGIDGSSRVRNIDSPASRLDTPDNAHLRELEQKYEAELQAHQATKAQIENQTAETDKTYREKLELLENDYQSAVSYVKGTEKMLKRMKDELTKYKKQNDHLQTKLEAAEKGSSDRSLDPTAASAWEVERHALNTQITEMQRQSENLSRQLSHQTNQLHSELQTTKAERDHHRDNHEQIQAQLAQHSQQHQQARSELEQLKSENSLLETRAIDAEQKVTVLLDQVSASVGNYRRQSHNMHANGGGGGHGHDRNLSNISGMSGISAVSTNPPLPLDHSRNVSADPSSFPSVPESSGDANRNSLALDTLASELETLRSHWEDNHRTYRLSNQFEFEHAASPTSASGNPNTMNESLADWRKRLSQERGVKGGLPRLSSDDERETNASRESAIVKPHDRMPGGISSDESEEEDDRDSKSYVI